MVFLAVAFSDGWDKCWEEGLTPWDLGAPPLFLCTFTTRDPFPKAELLFLAAAVFSVWFSSVTEILCVLQGHDVVAIACAERHVVGLDISDNAIKKATELSSGSPNAEHFTFLKTDFFTWCPDELFDLIVDYTYEEVLHPVGFKATYIVDNELAIARMAGRFIRTIASTETQLWAGQESGVRVWNYSDAYEPGTGTGRKVPRGDEDAAPFYESANTSPTICLMIDQGNKLVWSGHKDGRIRSWKMDQHFPDGPAFKEGFSWQAHRGPVLSMVISFYGDIWSGSDGGVIRVWPWESVEKSLSLSSEERRMAAVLVERSVIDLRTQVTVNGVCNISSSDVKCLLSDNVRAKVWAVGSLSFSLWNARTRELLKVFNIEGQLENRVDMSASQDQVPQMPFRVAKGAGAFVEDTKKTEAIVIAADGSAVSDVDIVVVGLQEVEMGAGFLAMSAAKETVGLEGSSVGQWWQDHIGKALDEGSTFERVGSRQLAALLIAIWVRKNLRTHVGDLDVAAVACGLGRAIGGVAGVSSANQMLRGANAPAGNPDEGRPDLAEADMVVFTGDFNYRLFGITYDESRDLVSQRSFDWLREKDQLRAEMKAGKVFQGMREALIRFPPTYKFEKGKPGLGGYDSGEKKRIPAWCDRVLYRDTRTAPTKECSLECPVIASILQYEACMEVTESDHKPVRCKLNVDIAHVDKSVRRQEFGKILESNETIRSNLEALRFVPETNVSTNRISLQNQDTFNLKITNRRGKRWSFTKLYVKANPPLKRMKQHPITGPRASHGFPRWLEVTPAAGLIRPDQVADISVHHEESHKLEEFVDGIPQSWWSEDTRDKELILLVIVRGSCSTDSKIHRVNDDTASQETHFASIQELTL
ncbi:hypothetical protein DH2020_047289 [Rehmannia glutinosa]|uniref:Inositol polyphosphate-related phosphatase domain-containing protein n=1 Tax=Rehmannia glutinosa TaxID=99300 RepID=A0ABR0U9F2_REHGL